MAQITVTGHLFDTTGAGLVGAPVWFELVNFGQNVPYVSGTNIVVTTKVIVVTTAGGAFTAQIQGNDTITPGNTFYKVTYNGNQVTYYSFTGLNPISLDSFPPLTVFAVPSLPQNTFALLSANNIFSGASNTINGVLYVGNQAADNGTDVITGILINGASSQSVKDQIGCSLTSIWTPNAVSPTSPYHFGYDSLLITGLGPGNTVASTNIIASGVFSANIALTASAGKTVNVTDLVDFVSNPTAFGGAGIFNIVNSNGVWIQNKGTSHATTSYALRIDAQSGSGTGYAIYTAGAGINKLGDVLQTSGKQAAIAYKSGSYLLTKNDEIILADCTTGNFTFTLPVATAALAGAVFTIKRIDSSGNTCTVSSNGNFIDASPTYALTAQFKYVTVTTNGTQWYIIGNN